VCSSDLELAVGGFHSQAGWISFVGLSMGVIAVTHRMRFFALQVADEVDEEINPTAVALLVPFLVLMASMMVTAALSQGFDRFYPLRVLVVAATLLWFRRIYARWNWSWSWSSAGIGAAVFVVWMALEPAPSSDGAALASSVAALGREGAAFWIGFRVIGSVLVIPLVEEMTFRGYLLRRLVSTDWENADVACFRFLPFLLSSAAFGLMHGRWLAGTLAGMAYALAFYRRGRLNDAVVSHMTTNALIALWVLVTGAWSLWV
jgi:exosortase E/protease (VPEID-CTERM system)